MAFLSVTSCVFACSASTSCTIKAHSRMMAGLQQRTLDLFEAIMARVEL